MKLPFDQNVSPKLVRRLADVYPDSDHVFHLGMDQAADSEIRKFAAANDFTIVTKDADYSEWLTLSGPPPKIVWIRRGNCSTNDLETLLRTNRENLENLLLSIYTNLLIIF